MSNAFGHPQEVSVHRCLGYIIQRNFYKKGSILCEGPWINSCMRIEESRNKDCMVFSNIPGYTVWIYSKGKFVHENVVTGELQERLPGYDNITNLEKPGTYRLYVEEDSEAFCLSPVLNRDITDLHKRCKLFHLKKGEVHSIDPCHIFLASGSFSKNGNTISAIDHIHFTEKSDIFIEEDCHGLMFGA